MHTLDLTEGYIHHVIQKSDPARYEALFPQLFEHYYTFWAQPRSYSNRDIGEIIHRRDLILEHLPLLVERFERKELKFVDIQVILFVGHGTSNGHAFPAMGKWFVWLPVETYHSPQAVEVFVSHEMAHALHYQQQPGFFFRDEREKNLVFRQLITEGIATLTSQEILEVSPLQALWADYLPLERIQRWYETCVEREKELLSFVKNHLDSSDERNRLFSFSASEDILENRGGYYAGLVLIEHYAKQHRLSLRDLFGISKEEFRYILQSSLDGYLKRVDNP